MTTGMTSTKLSTTSTTVSTNTHRARVSSKSEEMSKLKADILDQNICPDLASTAKNLVIGDGSLDAKIMFIGEAPGKNEDEKGLPFVGAAGKFLDEMLGSVGLDRQDVYITNIVKYRPPSNRDPLPEEKRAFLPFLMRQINIIQPQVIATLGRHSMECFMPDKKISQVHGRTFPAVLGGHKLSIVALYHPAAALYNGGLREQLLEDFKKVTKELD